MTHSVNTSPRNRRRGHRWAVTCLMLIVGLAAGCQQTEDPLEDRYGRRRGRLASKSVNGTNVLSGMFEEEGWDCVSWTRLSPNLTEADAIIWAPDSFVSPSDEQIGWFDTWLKGASERTLVFIGRDYDAAPYYWAHFAGKQETEDNEWFKREADQSKYVWRSDRRGMDDESSCRWYTFEKDDEIREIKALSKDSKWATNVNASDLEIRLRSKLVAPSTAGKVDVLLASKDGELIAYRVKVSGSQIIVIANGSFLLNLPLVNPQHRRLAGKLIAECEPSYGQKRAMFLEGTPLTLEIFETEPTTPDQNSFTLFNIWPLSIFLLHLALVGLISCFVIFPIFGRPKQIRDEGLSDFGKHIESLGALLASTENQRYALERLKYYEEHVRRDQS